MIIERPEKVAVSTDGSLLVASSGDDTLILYNQKNNQCQKWRIPTAGLSKKFMDFDWLRTNEILALDNTGMIWNLEASPNLFRHKYFKRGHKVEESTHSCLAVDGAGQRVATSARGEIKCWTVKKSGSLILCGSVLAMQMSPLVGGLKWSVEDGVLLAFYPFYERIARFKTGSNDIDMLGSVGPVGRLFSCTFSSNEHWALTYDGSHTARLLDMNSDGTVVAEMKVNFQIRRSPQPSALHFSKDCRTAIVIDDQEAVFISCSDGVVTNRVNLGSVAAVSVAGHSHAVLGVSHSSSQIHIIMGENMNKALLDEAMTIEKAGDGVCETELQGQKYSVEKSEEATSPKEWSTAPINATSIESIPEEKQVQDMLTL